jgi:hypothetical protein
LGRFLNSLGCTRLLPVLLYRWVSLMKYRFVFWLVIGGLPLLIYPALLIANIMSLAAKPAPNDHAPILLYLFANAFLWGSTLYPVVYVFSASTAIAVLKKGNPNKASLVALLPLLYLALVLAAMAGWMAMAR